MVLNVYVNECPLCFGGFRPERKRTPYSVVGVPMDCTASFRNGQRWGPKAIREASAYIEYYSTHLDFDATAIPIYDEGDVNVVYGDVFETLTRVRKVIEALLEEDRIPALLGGEHTLTLGSLLGMTSKYKRICVVVFDAHFDLRDEYLGNRLSHACVMKRVIEQVKPQKIFFIGVRAFSSEERRLAEDFPSIEFETVKDILKLGEVNVAAKARKFVEDCDNIYLSIDLDVLDPAYAPGVGNPEPEGLSSWSLFELITSIVDERLRGFDVVELSPPYDVGNITSIVAAKSVIEVIASHYLKTFKKKR